MAQQRPATLRQRSTLYREAVAIIESDYASALSLDEVAHRVACSRRQLQRSFAEIGQTTFREHVAVVRMRRAASLLVSSAMTVRDVAAAVGYRQPAQFAKAFRRQHGLAPSDHRTRGRSLSRAAPEHRHDVSDADRVLDRAA